ncbi:MAG TPA: fumarylacetoacetase [Solirubrobacteraceae bacterium]|jgi:fumarylacetoacetase
MSGGFGLENLPYGSVRREPGAAPVLCTRLGDDAIELGALPGLDADPAIVRAPNLDPLLAGDRATWTRVRESLRAALENGVPDAARIPLAGAGAVECLPFTVRDYVDFYSSIEHATNVGRLFRPDAEPLLPNWRHVPIGYHGRSATVVVSGTPVRRPLGQLPRPDGPVFGPTERLDIELELGFVAGGSPNALGEPIAMADVGERIFGFVLVNDWSARDVQRWEYVPLGPFLGKSFATSISAWVVPADALDGRRVDGPPQDPEPLEYLRGASGWSLDVDLEVELAGEVVSRGNSRGLYWNFAQQLVHAASNGAVVRPGDLYASGTISGPDRGTEGSLLELTRNGAEPLRLGGEQRSFLQDGDTVVLRGSAGAVALGEVRGTVVPAR